MKRTLPIVVSSMKQVRSVIKRYESSFDAFEVWLDYLEDLEDEQTAKSLMSLPKETLCLFRRKELEPSSTSVGKQKEIVQKVQGAQVMWDFDITIQEEQLEHFRSEKRASLLLCSYHNYQRTPANEELQELERRMDDFSPEVSKFACFCESKRDLLRLLEFQLQLQEKGKRSVVLGMGEEGMITRIFGEQFGNEYTFLSVVSDEVLTPTAPGQLSIEDLAHFEEILKRIRDGRK